MSFGLRLDQVNASYGGNKVLTEVSLAVPSGTAVALLGANGAGKTTLLKVAAGLVRTISGSVHVAGRDVSGLPVHARTRLGLCLIPEGHGIFRPLSVRDNLKMFGGERPVEAVLDKATSVFPALGSRLDQEAGTLSGGEQQMLALCRALVTDAHMILTDELSQGLAPVVLDDIFQAIEGLLAAGRSLLIVEQYVSRALALTDYVYILHKGSVVFVGEPAQCAREDVLKRYMGSIA